jgi:hypothetical protein
MLKIIAPDDSGPDSLPPEICNNPGTKVPDGQ